MFTGFALVAGVPVQGAGKKPNILVIWGDDIGQSNISAYTFGLVGYQTPNIDRVAREGMMFTDYYGEQSCTAGRSAFITGQSVFRTGLSKVGLPGADLGMREVVNGVRLDRFVGLADNPPICGHHRASLAQSGG